MKIEATSFTKKWNISIQYTMMNPLIEAETLLSTTTKLRRLPHVFSKILQLPLRSDADVSVEESPHCFRFMAPETDSMSLGHVETHTLHIHPGITKIVVRATRSLHFSLDDLNPDVWRFRLPESVLPELASAVIVDGVLIVTVPKARNALWTTSDDDDDDDNRCVHNRFHSPVNLDSRSDSSENLGYTAKRV